MNDSTNQLDTFKHLFNGTSFSFYLFAIIFALVIRFLLCIFKALAHRSGETSAEHEGKEFWSLMKHSFFSASKTSESYQINDYFLPLIIGFFELITFPLLLKSGFLQIIAVWLGFKAIGTWNTKNERTAYNRFLFGNILVLSFSYLLWHLFILKNFSRVLFWLHPVIFLRKVNFHKNSRRLSSEL